MLVMCLWDAGTGTTGSHYIHVAKLVNIFMAWQTRFYGFADACMLRQND